VRLIAGSLRVYLWGAKILQVIRRLLKALAYGSAVIMSLVMYDAVTTGLMVWQIYCAFIIITFIMAWLATLLTDWIFADRESSTDD
jgi:hypothetical protein